jgi:hypothetical protein
VEVNRTGGLGSRRAVAPSDDDVWQVKKVKLKALAALTVRFKGYEVT